jgi:hypothetical protein
VWGLQERFSVYPNEVRQILDGTFDLEAKRQALREKVQTGVRYFGALMTWFCVYPSRWGSGPRQLPTQALARVVPHKPAGQYLDRTVALVAPRQVGMRDVGPPGSDSACVVASATRTVGC